MWPATSPSPPNDGNYALQVGTGGYAGRLERDNSPVASLSGDITTQYVMRYTPDAGPNSEGKQFRRIKISVFLPTAQFRYRNGYYPFAPPH